MSKAKIVLSYLERIAEERKRVEDKGDELEITEPLVEDLLDSMKRTCKHLERAIPTISRLADKPLPSIPQEDIEQVRDYSGNLALLCNMILNGESYDEDDKRRAIEDSTFDD
jgi:hypothetical protein